MWEENPGLPSPTFPSARTVEPWCGDETVYVSNGKIIICSITVDTLSFVTNLGFISVRMECSIKICSELVKHGKEVLEFHV